MISVYLPLDCVFLVCRQYASTVSETRHTYIGNAPHLRCDTI